MQILKHSIAFTFCIAAIASFAQRGIDGNRTVNATNTIVNEYTTLTADAAAGGTTITVAASGLNTNTRFGAGNTLAAGDLIMIIQMQGISSTTSSSIEFPAGSSDFYGFPNDLTWGQTTSYNNCGNHEFCQVLSVPSATTITIDCGLKNAYTASGRVQIIRVPRYNSLTITGTGVLTCPAWAAGGIYTGGILAVEVYGATTIQAGGAINVSALGFRGGSRVGDNVTTLGGGQVSRTNATEGAEKGEGIFGYQADYNIIGGRFCRGIAGNAGGGGDAHNAGGGGGSNAGTGTWDGEGNPDVSGGAGWVAAWNLDISTTFATHVSSGGGRGGYSFSATNRNATLEGPKPFQAAGTNLWGGDYRINNGGWGGRPLDYSTGRIFLGGGGGAGDQENNCGGSGGIGGGLVYVLSYGTISGSGTINANGGGGSNTTSSGVSNGIDGAGGGGGGGTIILNSIGTVSGITASANGGIGGNQDVLPGVNEAEGPGGGGGGGYIAVSTGAITTTVNGAANGTTDSNGLTEFPPNGATRGAAGLTNQVISTDTINTANVTICSGNTASLTASIVGSIPATVNWYSAANGGSSIGTGTTFTTPTLVTTTTYYVGFCPGTYRIPVVVTVNTSPTASVAGPNQTVCATSATLAGNTPTAGTGTWTLVSGAGTVTTPSSPTSTVTALGLGPNVFQWTITNPPCGTSFTQVTITSTGGPTTSNAGTTQTVCGTTATLAGNTPTSGTGTWTLVSGAGTITTPSSPTSGITGLGAGPNVFQWSITSAPCPASTSTVTITGVASPTTSNAGTNQTICGTTATLAGNTATTGTGTWTLVSGAGTITTPTSPISGITGLGVGANVFQWTISNAPCTASSSTVTITGVTAPTTANAGTNQTICGTTATLAGNTATTGTGIWTLVSGAGTITTPSSPTSGITGLGVGANVFQWTISNAPCTASSSTVTITGVTAPTTANAGPNQTICGATTATLAGNTAITGTGTWTLVSGTGTITTPSSPTSGLTGLGAGANVFQWTISNAPCTSSSSTVTITVTTASDATIASVAPMCLGTAAFNLNAATAGGTWSGTGITSAATGTFNPAASGVGTFTITYSISGVCGNTDTALVTVVPNSDATILPTSSLCVSASPINLSAATAGGTWSGTGITSAASGTFDPATAGIGSFTITYTIPGTCGATDTAIVTVSATSNATITSTSPVCLGTAAFNLSAATAGGTWTGTGITSAASGTFNPATAGVGTFVITYTISGTCGASDTESITVTPSANATITTVTPICANASPFNLTAATAGGTWSGTGITNASTGTFDPALATAGPNTITYSIAGACGDTATQTVTVNALPTPAFTADVASGCAPLCVTFTEAASNTCNSMSYNFGDGNTSTLSSAVNCYSNAGTYSVTISCTDLNGCTGTNTITNMITVSPTPVAAFTSSPSGVLPVGSTVTFTDVSSAGGISFWNFDDPASGSNTSALSSDSHTYSTEGTYCILLISSNGSSCIDSTRQCIIIADEATISIPNVFTPNNDGTNDIFYFKTSSVKDLTCSIYDRWGLKIAEWTAANDAKTGWDGRSTSGLEATDGVYYFVMKANTMNNKVVEQKGFVQLLKEQK